MRILRHGVAADGRGGDSITAVAVGGEHRASRVQVRYRRANGEFVDTSYWSAPIERLVVYESRLELARIMLADHDPEVSAIAAQPFQLTGPDKERVRRHVPDLLLVDRDGGVTVVDVKAASKLSDPAVAEVFAWTGGEVAATVHRPESPPRRPAAASPPRRRRHRPALRRTRPGGDTGHHRLPAPGPSHLVGGAAVHEDPVSVVAYQYEHAAVTQAMGVGRAT
jgi:hypothetical protein